MKRRGVAEQMFNDMVGTIREKQEELEKAIADYTSNVPAKPMMDVIEDDENIIVKTDLPGVKKGDIKIDITEDSIEISAKFEEETEVEDVNYIKKERRYGEASRMMVLPAKILINESNAKFENGVLTVTLPKLEKNESFEVKVD
ncbi:Hsp20/alpha crystallin family protein [Methanobacterium aggregans]|uniref:Hsp20/alpha crystallin family protein n=1 Tax=Methanobacterium aggregans TaxID=1615586 RepID=UPI001AE57819|nr:Hsp20/alpha crystallin family protein [Methanobacterium aggregans]MBP2046872.1 HSP20 family protein [Methanobacterium aggregans]